MDRQHAPNQFLRTRKRRVGTRAWEGPWRMLADGPHQLANRQGDDG